jgi:hypothetical protein
MARYFFYLYDGDSKNLVRDSEGAEFSSLAEAKNEAIGLGQDIVGHGIDRSTWQVLVIDENGHQVLRVPLSKVRARKFRTWIDLAHRIATYQPRFRSWVFTWLLTAAVLAMIGQAIVFMLRVKESSDSSYHLASAEAESRTLYVRFVSKANIADIETFMQIHKTFLVSGPLPGGWYRLRVSGSAASPEELRNIARTMAQEDIVSLVFVGRSEDVR